MFPSRVGIVLASLHRASQSTGPIMNITVSEKSWFCHFLTIILDELFELPEPQLPLMKITYVEES